MGIAKRSKIDVILPCVKSRTVERPLSCNQFEKDNLYYSIFCAKCYHFFYNKVKNCGSGDGKAQSSVTTESVFCCYGKLTRLSFLRYYRQGGKFVLQ